MVTTLTFSVDDMAPYLVEALRKALEEVMPEIMEDNNLSERNGYGQFRWNVIISQLRDTCQHLGWIDIGICKRGAWKTPVLFHSATGMLITFMTEETFKDVQRRQTKGKHYLCAGARFNQGLQAQEEQLAMELPPIEVNLEGWIAKSQEQLAEAVHAEVGEVNGHILVLFRERGDKLLSVRAIRLTEKLEISTEDENWSHLIGKPYTTDKVVSPNQADDDEGESLVELL